MMAIKALLGAFLVLTYSFCPALCKDIKPSELPAKKFPADDPAIKKFEIHVADSILIDLKSRLSNTKFSEPLDNVEFQYGFPASYLKVVVDYWKDNFDWRKQEKELNKFSQYTTEILGIDVHFIHQKPNLEGKTKVKVYPLLMSHGWPGSIAEFTKIIPLLTTPRNGRDYVFEVICPSIPGFGFSEASHEAGFNIESVARIFTKLMDRLGFPQYYVHGGDMGSIILSEMAVLYPDKVLGAHLTFLSHKIDGIALLKYAVGRVYPPLFMNKDEVAKFYPISKLLALVAEETGYFHIQATKPDTVGAALSDSPAGLVAYILEKFSTSTDISFRELKDGGLTKKFTLDELLTNVMIYWSTNTITSSMRFYKEFMAPTPHTFHYWQKIPIKVPVGVAAFPNEYFIMPRAIINHTVRKIIRYTHMPRGGHFAAMEEPVLLSNDIWDFIVDVKKSQTHK